jgi:Tfp pilus assembly protein PilO
VNIRKEKLLTIAIFGVIVITFVFVVFLPQRRELARLQQECEQASADLRRDKEKARELARVVGDVSIMSRKLEFYDQRLPDDQELGQFLRDVSSFARASGLTADFKPQRVVAGELYMHMPIEINIRGRFLRLTNFLLQAKEMKRLTHVSDLMVDNSKQLDGECEITLTMNIYFTRG